MARTGAGALEETLKAQDADRWLSSRFIADGAARDDLVALYGLDNELAAVSAKATNPLMGEIRFAWWREGLEAIRDGAAQRSHPALEALVPAIRSGALPIAPLLAAIEARHVELDEVWFADEPALDLYLDGLTGVTLAAAMRLDPAVAAEAVRPAGRVIAFSQLLRRAATSPRPGWTPQAWDAAADTDVAAHLGHKLDLLVDEARSAAPVSPGAFPAIAHAALALTPNAGPIARRVRLTLAVLRGRI